MNLPLFYRPVPIRTFQRTSSCGVPAGRALPRVLMCLALVIIHGVLVKDARASGENNPVGVARAMNAAGVISSAGSYSAYTGSTSRTVPDLVVPGGVGAYPLVFSRTSTSRYVPGDDSYGGTFGLAGSWRHSYRWGFYQDNPGQTPAIWRVHYPSGSVVRFAYMTVSAPNASSPTPPADPYMRSTTPGVSDRLENPSGTQNFILHLSDGGRVSFQLKSNGNYLVQWIADPYNQYTTFSYYTSGTGAGLIQNITEPAGRWLQLSYVVEGSNTVVASVTASDGQSVTYNYTVQGTAPNTTTFLTGVTYNSDPNPATGNPAQATYGYQADNTGTGLRPLLGGCNDPHFPGPLPQISYSYTQGSSVPYGQIAAEIDLATNTTISSYNQSNLTETRGDGPTSTYDFNSYLISQQQDYDGGKSSFGYDANSYLSSFTNCNGHAITTTCEPYAGKPLTVSRTDTNNQLLTTTFNYGGTSSVPYPLNPYWVNNITDPRGQKTTFTRDSNNQITKVAYPDGTYETFSYNSFGQVTYHLKTDGSSYTAQYDGSGNLNQSTNSFNSSANKYTYYYYDSLDRLSQVKDFNGHNTWYTYNGRHLLTQYKHDDGTHVDYAYDVYGNQTSVSDELQHVTLIAYDNHRRPTSVQVPVNAGNTTTRTTTFTYERGSDTTGNAHTKRGFGTETLDSGKQIKRVYTGNGHLHSVTKGYGNSDATTDTYFYDGVGHLSAMVDANNFTQAAYAYDALERRSTLTDANGHVTTWNYYAAGSGAYAGWLQSKQAPGPTMGGTATTEYLSYDAVGHLLSSQDPLGNPEGRSYDANGRLSSLSDSKGSYTFGYDALARRKSLTFPDASTQLWTYDPAGNLLTYTNRAGNVKTWQYDDRNRKTRYDWSNGAAVSVAYSYDSASRMTEVQNAWADLRYTYVA